MTEPLSDKQIDRLIAGYLAGSLSEAALPHFERWLLVSPEHPRRVARLSITDLCIREVCQDTKSDYLLAALNQIDQASGPAQLVTLHHLNASPWQRYRLHAIWGAIAAALLLAVALSSVLLTGPDTQTLTDNTPTPNKPATSTQSTPRGSNPQPVATLTAQHNAQWGRPASAGPEHPPTTGSKLHPGTHLTLTAGFAEITTTRGAIAILEAPATIELLNDNALRLHTGKLVGICETDSSKGFLVRTPHMDITDLGTQFGVAIDHAGKTLAEVFEGSIQIGARSISGTGIHSRRLFAGDVAVLDQSGELNDQHNLGEAVFASLIKQAARSLQGIDAMSGQVEAIERGQVLKQGRYEPLGMANAWVCEELRGHVLTKDAPVSVRLPKRYMTLPTEPVAPIPQGTRIRSYIIGLDPLTTGDAKATQHNAAQGSITFDGEIIGVIAKDTDGRRFTRSFADEAAADLFPITIGKIEFPGDWFAIKKDQRTIEFGLSVANNSDQIRVLVLEEEQP